MIEYASDEMVICDKLNEVEEQLSQLLSLILNARVIMEHESKKPQ